MSQPLTIVLGFPRSGTTLTGQLVGSIIGQQIYGEPFNPLRARAVKPEHIEDLREIYGTHTYPAWLLELIKEFSENHSRYGGYKETFGSAVHVAAHPKARFVFVTRNPYAIVPAWLRRFNSATLAWYLRNLERTYPDTWVHYTQAQSPPTLAIRIAAAHRIRLQIDQTVLLAEDVDVFSLDFAELVANHESELTRLMRFLGFSEPETPTFYERVQKMVHGPYRKPDVPPEHLAAVDAVWDQPRRKVGIPHAVSSRAECSPGCS